jgi:PAS domain S-box-containing protein
MPSRLMDRERYRQTLSSMIAAPIVGLAILLAVSLLQIYSLISDLNWVDRTDSAIGLADEAARDLLVLQRDAHWYLLYRDVTAQRRMARTSADIANTLRRLKQMTEDNPGQQMRLRDIDAAYGKWNAATQAELAHPETANGVRRTPWPSSLLADQVVRGLSEVVSEERSLRVKRKAVAFSQARWTFGVVIFATIVAGSVIILTVRRRFILAAKSYEDSVSLARNQAEALEQSEEYLTTTLRSIGEAVIATDAKRRVTFMNPVAEQLTGWSHLHAARMPLGTVLRIVEQESGDPVEIPGAAGIGKSPAALDGPNLLISRDEARIPIDHSASPIQRPDGTILGSIVVFRDTTERRRMEEQLIQSQKMESVGQLAGGIAHDFNNMLTAILGYTELAASAVPQDGQVAEFLQHIERSAQRSASLTRQLLAFARKQMAVPAPLDINTVLRRIDPLVRRIVGERIDVVLALAHDLSNVYADTGQIEQVLLNLTVNARDAMPTGGRLVFETANVSLDAEQARLRPDVTPGDYVRLAVSDTGTGMDESVRKRVFEPFFTTKEVGQGTGLGLAACYGIVKQSGGHITVESGPGRGTRFTIDLPAVIQQAAIPAPGADEGDGPRGTESILLAEDQP